MIELLYATTNSYKVLAANTVLKEFSIELEKIPTDTPDVSEIQSDIQAEVAVDKAKKFYAALNQPLIVMDFGFFIEALNGFPGVYTKYAIETIGVDGLITLAKTLSDKRAYTERTIVYIDGDNLKTFSYRCPGTILTEKRGDSGRDYDYIFCVDATGKTLAEMTEQEKAIASGEAWRQFGQWLNDKYDTKEISISHSGVV